jgi:DNA polymerase-4
MPGEPARFSLRDAESRKMSPTLVRTNPLPSPQGGVDDSAVVPDRPTKSISVEDTFEQDVLLTETEPMIRHLAEKLWSASRKESRLARTMVLKLKTSEFKILTRSHTPDFPPSSCEELADIVLKLREKVDLGPNERYRLVGLGLSNFREAEQTAAQPPLFE